MISLRLQINKSIQPACAEGSIASLKLNIERGLHQTDQSKAFTHKLIPELLLILRRNRYDRTDGILSKHSAVSHALTAVLRHSACHKLHGIHFIRQTHGFDNTSATARSAIHHVKADGCLDVFYFGITIRHPGHLFQFFDIPGLKSPGGDQTKIIKAMPVQIILHGNNHVAPGHLQSREESYSQGNNGKHGSKTSDTRFNFPKRTLSDIFHKSSFSIATLPFNL